MPPFTDDELVIRGNLGTRIPKALGRRGKAGEYIEFRDDCCGLPNTPRFAGNARSDLLEQSLLDLQNLFFGS